MNLTREDFDNQHVVAEWTDFDAGNNYAVNNGDYVLLLSTEQYALIDENRIADPEEISWKD